MADGNWCLIESDPGVLSELMRKLGVQGVQAEELFDLSPEGLSKLAPVYGLIFLFKWQPGSRTGGQDYAPPGLFFAQQVIQNACATQALLNILLNVDGIDIGPELKSFKEFTADFTPDMRGAAISNQETVRTVHNSFARPEVFSMSRPDDEKEDAFHFVGYVPYGGRLYELDGLQQGPIDHGVCDKENWTTTAGEILQKRIAEYNTSEIRFNLCALIQDRKEMYAEQIEAIKLSTEGQANADDSEVRELEHLIAVEDEKRSQATAENMRRRHNYIPLFLELLRTMAKSGNLKGAVEHGQARYKEKVEAYQQKQAEKQQQSKA